MVVGIRLRRLLPEHHLSADSRDAVKLAMGLVATMTALVLGLLISSAKGTFDTERNEVLQLAAKVAFLTACWPSTDRRRRRFARSFTTPSRKPSGGCGRTKPARRRSLNPDAQAGDAIYTAIQSLPSQNDVQRSLKAQAAAVAVEVGQLQTLLTAQSASSVSKPLLTAMVSWLVVIFLGFSLLAPPNATTAAALLASVFSVAVAIFLIVELDQPMSGFIRISSGPMVNVLNQFTK